MSNGRIEQIGPPKEVYEEPSTAYVADFLGVSNLMDAVAYGPGAHGCKVKLGEFELVAGEGEPDAQGEVACRSARSASTSTRRALRREPDPRHGRADRLRRLDDAGDREHRPGDKLQALVANEGEVLPFEQGTAVPVHLPREALRVLPQGLRRGLHRRGPGDALAGVRSRSGRSPRRPMPRPVPPVEPVEDQHGDVIDSRDSTIMIVAIAFRLGFPALRAAL